MSRVESEQSLRVLLVDDEPAIVGAVRELLDGDERITVIAVAADGDGAVACAELSHPDLAVVDVRMPGGGPDLLARLRRVSPRTVVVVLSADPRSATRDAMLEAGAAAFLTKGNRLPDLPQVLLDLAGSRRD